MFKTASKIDYNFLPNLLNNTSIMKTPFYGKVFDRIGHLTLAERPLPRSID